MRPIVSDRYGEPDVMRLTDVPVSEPQEVLIRVGHSGIDPTDSKAIAGHFAGAAGSYDRRRPLPPKTAAQGRRAFNSNDPQDWVSLFSSVLISLVGSNLSTHTRRQPPETANHRNQIQRLYEFSVRLLETKKVQELPNELPNLLLESFRLRSAALYFSHTLTIHKAGAMLPQLASAALENTFVTNDVSVNEEAEVYLLPIRLGEHAIGSFGVCGAILSKETLGAIATLIAIAIGRARTIELLRETKAARESEHFKSTLLDAIAHDFKTPLTAIKVAATSLLEGRGFNKKQRRELLVIINEECDRLNRVVGESIHMARLDAGHVKLQVATHTVDKLVSAALEDCKNIRATRQIKTEVSEPRRSVRADLLWTTRVFDHLIRNADLYSRPGQPITISTEDQNGFVLFHVADIGPGIDKSEIQHIFEKFFRGKRQRDRVPGTGMGLAVAKAIIEAHGGKIEATSEPGRGATFTFSLPRD